MAEPIFLFTTGCLDDYHEESIQSRDHLELLDKYKIDYVLYPGGQAPYVLCLIIALAWRTIYQDKDSEALPESLLK